MNLLARATALAQSTHTGRALKVAKLLNLVGTVRGAVTTVVLAASAIGVGTATVQSVRQDEANLPARTARVVVRPSLPPTPSPVTGAGLKADAEKRLQAALAADAQAVDDLRKIAVLTGAPLDALVADAKQRLQARYEQAIAQVNELLAPSASASPGPSPSPSIIAVNALVQVATSDMSALVVIATRQATEPAAVVTPKPTVAPTPIRTPAPRTPSPSVRPTPTR